MRPGPPSERAARRGSPPRPTINGRTSLFPRCGAGLQRFSPVVAVTVDSQVRGSTSVTPSRRLRLKLLDSDIPRPKALWFRVAGAGAGPGPPAAADPGPRPGQRQGPDGHGGTVPVTAVTVRRLFPSLRLAESHGHGCCPPTVTKPAQLGL